jgi:hypothetical protein
MSVRVWPEIPDEFCTHVIRRGYRWLELPAPKIAEGLTAERLAFGLVIRFRVTDVGVTIPAHPEDLDTPNVRYRLEAFDLPTRHPYLPLLLEHEGPDIGMAYDLRAVNLNGIPGVEGSAYVEADQHDVIAALIAGQLRGVSTCADEWRVPGSDPRDVHRVSLHEISLTNTPRNVTARVLEVSPADTVLEDTYRALQRRDALLGLRTLVV